MATRGVAAPPRGARPMCAPAGQLRVRGVKSGLFPGRHESNGDNFMSASGSHFSRRTLLESGVYATVGFAVARAGLAQAADKSLPLITKTVPSTKEKLPVIGIGTNNFGVTDAAELASRHDVLKRLPELGGAIVDTAQVYGTLEQVIGDAVVRIGNRSKLF